jgi:endo-1,4-beta-D-glucanase Y
MGRLAWTVALALGLAIPTAACGRSTVDGEAANEATDSGPAAPGADRRATDAAYAFLDTYTRNGGRIARLDQGADTVGEGQAYGMLAAAAVGDAKRFDRIWNWTKRHARRDDGLLVFRWAKGAVVDDQAAADADLDAAHALLVASCRFDRRELREEAERLGATVLERETARAAGQEVLLAGPWAAQSKRLVVNPSYLDPLTLTALGHSTGNTRYAALARDGRRILARLAAPLPPDWATVDQASGRPTPASDANGAAGGARFTFDAPRTLIRLAVDPSPAGRRIAARAWPVFRERATDELRVEHELDGRQAGDTRSPLIQVAASASAMAAGDDAAARRLLDAADRVALTYPSYYGAAWVALGRLMLTTRRLRVCTVR